MRILWLCSRVLVENAILQCADKGEPFKLVVRHTHTHTHTPHTHRQHHLLCVFPSQVRYERADGSVRWLRCAGGKTSSESTAVYGSIEVRNTSASRQVTTLLTLFLHAHVCVQDVTDRKRTQAMLEQRVSLCERVVDATLDATMLINTQDEVILEASAILNAWAGRPLEGGYMSRRCAV